MKNTKIQFVIVSALCVFFYNCNQEPQRDLYPNELLGGLDLLPSEKTGIDFSNTIKESTYFNHYYYSQMYVGSVSSKVAESFQVISVLSSASPSFTLLAWFSSRTTPI